MIKPRFKKLLNLFILLLFFIIFIFSFLIFLVNSLNTEIDESDISVKFLLFGHVHPNHDALNSNIDLILEENPDFIVFLGDTIAYIDYPNPSDWRGKNTLEPFLKKMKAPLYFVPGNHDLDDGSNEEYFKKYFSKNLYQSFDFKENTFIILNTHSDQTSHKISNEQIPFIKSIFKNKKNNRKFIFMHHCLFYKDENKHCNVRKMSNIWKNEIIPIIQNEISAVFVGDSGGKEYYFSYLEDRIKYFGVGFTSPMGERPQYFLRVIIKNDGSFIVTPVIMDGIDKEIPNDINKIMGFQKIWTAKVIDIIKKTNLNINDFEKYKNGVVKETGDIYYVD